MFGILTQRGFEAESQKVHLFCDLKAKVVDVMDVGKDHYYYFKYPHWNFFSLILSSSMVLPYLVYHVTSDLTEGMIASLFMYLGLSKVRSQLDDREKIGALYLSTLENLPQFNIQFAELFIFGNSITFAQAGFPLITLMAIYSFAGKVFARMLYNEVYWDGKESRKNRIGKSIKREERDRPYLAILGTFLILPPIIMISMINFLNVKHDQINADLYDLKMLPEFDKNYGSKYPIYALTIFTVLILKKLYDLKKALDKRRELPEPPDQWRRLFDHPYLSRTALPSGVEWYVNANPS